MPKILLLEPIINVKVKIPEEFMGDIMGDISGKRGKIIGLYDYERFQILNLNGVKETPKITDIKIIY